ncbi:MAG TPA: hypothetical protein PKE69_15325 [Pyrinomonadaceae bacterium]|nr:hypothetical protein [Pyrinomonadaceae bacterium]
MKFVFLLILCICFAACSANETASNPNNQKLANANKPAPNANQTPIAVNNIPTSNVTKNPSNSGIILGEKFTLKNGEKGTVKDTNLELKVTTAGTMSAVANAETKQIGAGISYCRVDATLKDKTDGRQLYTQTGKTDFVFEGYKIQVQEIVPTGNISCTFIITKN